MKNYILEVCVDSVESAINASNGGANRLELCGNLIIGGTTPSKILFEAIKEKVTIPINVLIRPRYGDFCYSDFEFDIIRNEIKMFKELGAAGVVIGVLEANGDLDYKRMKLLVEAAKGMNVTLHRAFDMCNNPFKALEQAKELGIDTILTSGQGSSCIEGVRALKELVEKSNGAIDILVGAGVSSGIIADIYQYTGATSYHMSGKITIAGKMIYKNDKINMGIKGINEYDIWQTKEEYVKQAVEVLQGL